MSKMWLYGLILGLTLQVLAGQPTALKSATTIQSIDFKNFTYPWPRDLLDPSNPKRTFRLTNGELPETRTPEGRVDGMGVFFKDVNYGDVTGDGINEAIVSLSVLTGGSAIPHIIYVYTLKNKQPKLLWCFATGDRADGGFRRAYAQRVNLIVELNSPIGKQGDCCPTRFTRTQYQWVEKRFRKKREELLLLNENSSSPIATEHLLHRSARTGASSFNQNHTRTR